MNTKVVLQQFEVVVTDYLEALESYDWERLTYKPSAGEWSLGQMYMHLIQSALYMQLRNVELCMIQNKEDPNVHYSGEKTEQGKRVYAQGSFPPIQIQVPASPEYTPAEPESKEQIRKGLEKVLERMRDLEPKLHEGTHDSKIQHPGLGFLHAKEWYALVEMHFRHHFLQKTRLEQMS
ncbi:DinB family protein [Brevibacillus daliensis]|uniref:DinB family protein n=1 Tax=Brevibacillus daliensis TaxID=2892995 RepID=UPI001E39E20B|nr:DinB family protein [Brevibacillus daliensis]